MDNERIIKHYDDGDMGIVYLYKDKQGYPVKYYKHTYSINSDNFGDGAFYVSFNLIPSVSCKYFCYTYKDGSKDECISYNCPLPGYKPVIYKKHTESSNNQVNKEGFVSTNTEYFGVLNDVENSINNNVLIPVKNAFESVGDKVEDALTSVLDPIKSVAKSIINSVESAGQNVGNFVTKTIPNTVSKVANKVGSYAETAFNVVKNEVTDLLGKIKDADIPGKFMSIVNKAGDVGKSVGNFVYDNMGNSFGFLKDGATVVFDKVKDGVLDAKDYVVKYSTLIGDKISNISKKIGDGFYDISQTISEQGKKVVDKITSGMKPMIETGSTVTIGMYHVVDFFGKILLRFFKFLSSEKGLFIFKGVFVLFSILSIVFLYSTMKMVKAAITGKGDITNNILK